MQLYCKEDSHVQKLLDRYETLHEHESARIYCIPVIERTGTTEDDSHILQKYFLFLATPRALQEHLPTATSWREWKTQVTKVNERIRNRQAKTLAKASQAAKLFDSYCCFFGESIQPSGRSDQNKARMFCGS